MKKWKKLLCSVGVDVTVAALCVGGFLTNFYLMPHSGTGIGTVLASTDTDSGTGTFSLPDESEANASAAESTESSDFESEASEETESAESDSGSADSDSTDSESSGSQKPGGRGGPGSGSGGPGSGSGGPGGKSGSGGGSMTNGNTNTKSITADQEASTEIAGLSSTSEVLNTYRSDDLQYTITKTTLGSGDDIITYYTADIYITDITQLMTAFADGTYGKNYRESVQTMAEENDAILAISGDSYGNSDSGVVVRNGVLYRDETNDAEICVLFKDGTMKIYTPEEFDSEGVLEEDVWQVWNFGPSLLTDGVVNTTFQTTDYLNSKNPRCAIGYVSAGHYKFVVVDGRSDGYSTGATMSELAAIMESEGCTLAYNLDGGKSAEMVQDGEVVNQPAGGGREISDIIYITE